MCIHHQITLYNFIESKSWMIFGKSTIYQLYVQYLYVAKLRIGDLDFPL